MKQDEATAELQREIEKRGSMRIEDAVRFLLGLRVPHTFVDVVIADGIGSAWRAHRGLTGIVLLRLRGERAMPWTLTRADLSGCRLCGWEETATMSGVRLCPVCQHVVG